ncbi:hypothetical protein TSOC_003777 [Tetrabaena socialis]|uniref:Uncharacterized protein n=1 Tax=Tetrabaena socialis TaxID=47790 RepID=A0A2J8AAP5_9CHLO|nr:hypothetical protein TSOC_003777 [Tetrabaena socialis]|eukprot:PNH09591.1 hypothetical protein TSOC_003777 [Tetrabaena socialis]
MDAGLLKPKVVLTERGRRAKLLDKLLDACSKRGVELFVIPVFLADRVSYGATPRPKHACLKAHIVRGVLPGRHVKFARHPEGALGPRLEYLRSIDVHGLLLVELPPEFEADGGSSNEIGSDGDSRASGGEQAGAAAAVETGMVGGSINGARGNGSSNAAEDGKPRHVVLIRTWDQLQTGRLYQLAGSAPVHELSAISAFMSHRREEELFGADWADWAAASPSGTAGAGGGGGAAGPKRVHILRDVEDVGAVMEVTTLTDSADFNDYLRSIGAHGLLLMESPREFEADGGSSNEIGSDRDSGGSGGEQAGAAAAVGTGVAGGSTNDRPAVPAGLHLVQSQEDQCGRTLLGCAHEQHPDLLCSLDASTWLLPDKSNDGRHEHELGAVADCSDREFVLSHKPPATKLLSGLGKGKQKSKDAKYKDVEYMAFADKAVIPVFLADRVSYGATPRPKHACLKAHIVRGVLPGRHVKFARHPEGALGPRLV